MSKKIITDISFEIRPFLTRDLDQMMKLEKRVFTDYPWTAEDFSMFMRKEQHQNDAFVAEWRENILGFMLFVKNTWNFEIANMAVSPEFRSKGIGSALVSKLRDKLVPWSREEIVVHVRESNKNAVHFFQNRAFKIIEYVEDYLDKDKFNEACFKLKYEVPELPLKEEYKHL